MSPLIRWAGSKRQMVNRLSEFIPESVDRYVEPFCGSACLFFHSEPQHAVLGDLNHELILMYRTLRNNPDPVIEALLRIPRGKSSFLKQRSLDPNALSSTERAARFIFLNRNCFNGLYRTNMNGDFNVPYGPPKRKFTFRVEFLHEVSALLRRAELISGDFVDTLEHVESGDFVYLDPPYATDNRRVFREYLPDSFSTGDLERLADELRRIDQQGASFVLSYADCPEARSLLRPWATRRIRTKRNIAGFSGARKFAFELLATNIE